MTGGVGSRLQRLWLAIVERPFVAGAVVVVVSALFALQLPALVIDISPEGLMVKDDPARRVYEDARRRFGNDRLGMIVVKADDVFTAPALAAVRRLTAQLERVDGVARVESLATVRNIRGEADRLDTEPLVPPEIPRAPDVLARIRTDALRNPVLVGSLVARDARATAIIAYLDPGRTGADFSRGFTRTVDALIAREAAPGLSMYQLGKPFAETALADAIAHDQKTLIPISGAVLFVTLLIAFRTAQGVVIPMLTGALGLVWAFGAMAALGIPVNVLTSALPSLLVAVGFTEDVHMIAEYHRLLGEGRDRHDAVREMMHSAGLAIVVTTGTTVVGFLSLVTTDITLLVQFGLAAAIGLVANFLVTVLVAPTVLRLWPVPARLRRSAFAGGSPDGPPSRGAERWAAFIVAHRVAIGAASGLVVAASLAGWYTLRVDTNWVSYFPERSAVRERMADVHRSLSGAMVFYAVVDTGRPDGIKDPVVLRKIAGLQEFLARTGRVDVTVSIADYVKLMHRELHDGDPAFATVPDAPDQVAQYLVLLDTSDVAKLLDFDASAANVMVRHNITSSWELARLLREVEAYVAAEFPRSVAVHLTGEEVLINRASDYMVVNEVTSFGGTLLVIGAIHALLFMSLRAGALSLVPNVVPILCNFGLMGLLGIPLNTGTAVVATIAIGIAVDDTVHHMIAYSRHLNAHHDQRVAMVKTLQTQTRPIVSVSVALAAGFLVLAASSFVPARQIALLSAFVMLVALAGELTLTPLLMYSTRLVTLWDLVRLRMDPELLRRAPLFRDFSQWEARKVVLLGRLASYTRGDLVVRKGDAGAEMYMVVTGAARVFDVDADGVERTLTTLGPGDVFGEVAVVGGGVRSASVIAEAPTEVLALDFRALERIRRRFPYTGAKLFRNLARNLGTRLRDQTETLLRAPTGP